MFITLFEHEAHPFPWTDQHLLQLEQMNRAIGTDVVRATVRRGIRQLQAAQHVGVVRFGKHTIQILPKIYANTTSEPAEEATRNLLHLLAYAGDLPLHEHAPLPLRTHTADWLEILTRLFATRLMEAWQRGAVRQYQPCEDNSPILRGTWRIAAQLRRPERQHQFAITYDEFTADNTLNRMFRFVVERLWRLTRDAGNRQRLTTLREWMDDVTLLPTMTVTQADTCALTRLQREYAPLLHLARLFLDGGALQMVSGDLTTFAFVFDMNRLYEAFLINFLRRHRAQILTQPPLCDCDLLPQSVGAMLPLAHVESQAVFRLKPDLALRYGDEFPLLIDAKYKRLHPTERALGVSTSDFYQMHAYAHRYRCPRVLLIYPQTAGMDAPPRRAFRLENGAGQVEVATLDLRVALHQPAGRQHVIERLRMCLQEQP